MSRGHKRRWSPERLAALRPGDQPVVDGDMVCRLCGRPYAKLSQHLRMGEGVDPDEYRARFELPATMPLMAERLRAVIGARSKELVATNPVVRAALELDVADSAQRAARLVTGRRRARETAGRAGVVRKQRERGALAGDEARERAEQHAAGLDALARSRGYQDVGHLLRETADQTAGAVGASLGWSAKKVERLRAEHGVSSQLVAARRGQAAAARRVAVESAEPGVQPAGADGKLVCLEVGCGWPYHDLVQHVRQRHGLTAEQYRQRHALGPDCLLVSAERHSRQQQASVANLAGASARSAALRAEQTRQGYDEQARKHGYPDIVALLQAQPSLRDAARLLGVQPKLAGKLRTRYCSPASS